MKSKSNLIMDHKLMFGLLMALVLILSAVAIKSSNEDASLKSFEKEINKIEYFSNSDEVGAIETDLINTNFDNIGIELEKIESELN